jgi:hypothetical protein
MPGSLQNGTAGLRESDLGKKAPGPGLNDAALVSAEAAKTACSIEKAALRGFSVGLIRDLERPENAELYFEVVWSALRRMSRPAPEARRTGPQGPGSSGRPPGTQAPQRPWQDPPGAGGHRALPLRPRAPPWRCGALDPAPGLVYPPPPRLLLCHALFVREALGAAENCF